MDAPAIALEGLRARYAGQGLSGAALLDVSLRVQCGERLLLLGPNGAGKSTLIRVLAGLMQPVAGTSSILGLRPRDARSLVGVVAHTTYLYDELTAEENLVLYGELYGVARPRPRARALLDQLGLGFAAARRVDSLSRGQQQRVAIARAVMHDPPVLLLDEPDTGLDPAALEAVASTLFAEPRSVVLTTHNLATGLRWGTHAAVLARGRLVRPVAALDPGQQEELAATLHALAGGAPSVAGAPA